MAVGYAPSLPLSVSKEDGEYALLKTLESVAQQNLKMLFLTCPGERIMDINFGIGIRNYLFEPYVEQTLGDIRSRSYNQIRKYLPYIQVKSLVFDGGESVSSQDGGSIVDNLLSITVTYEIVPLAIGAVLTIPISS